MIKTTTTNIFASWSLLMISFFFLLSCFFFICLFLGTWFYFYLLMVCLRYFQIIEKHWKYIDYWLDLPINHVLFETKSKITMNNIWNRFILMWHCRSISTQTHSKHCIRILLINQMQCFHLSLSKFETIISILSDYKLKIHVEHEFIRDSIN